MNIYQPHLMRIVEITDETVDTRTLKLEFKAPAMAREFKFSAGQFGEYSAFGEGESRHGTESAYPGDRHSRVGGAADPHVERDGQSLTDVEGDSALGR